MDNTLNVMEMALEKELIRSAKNGDKKCLEALIKKYEGYIKKTISKYAFSREESEEAYNVCIVGLLDALDRFDITQNIKFYTFSSFHMKKELNNFIKFECSIKKRVIYKKRYEKEKSYIQLKNIDDCLDVKDSNDNQFNQIENKIFVEEIFKKLSSDDVNILKLSYFEGKKQEEIAKELNTKIDKIKIKKSRILNFIRREVEIG